MRFILLAAAFAGLAAPAQAQTCQSQINTEITKLEAINKLSEAHVGVYSAQAESYVAKLKSNSLTKADAVIIDTEIRKMCDLMGESEKAFIDIVRIRSAPSCDAYSDLSLDKIEVNQAKVQKGHKSCRDLLKQVAATKAGLK